MRLCKNELLSVRRLQKWIFGCQLQHEENSEKDIGVELRVCGRGECTVPDCHHVTSGDR
jgi:predicted transcriptional regulator